MWVAHVVVSDLSLINFKENLYTHNRMAKKNLKNFFLLLLIDKFEKCVIKMSDVSRKCDKQATQCQTNFENDMEKLEYLLT